MSKSGTSGGERAAAVPRSVFAFGANVVAVPLGIINSVIIARALGPMGKGSLDLMMATAALLGMALGLSLPSGVTYVVARGRAALGALAARLAGVAVAQGLLTAALLALLVLAGRSSAFLPEGAGGWYVAGVALVTTCVALTGYWHAALVGRQEIVRANQRELAGRLLQTCLLVSVAAALYATGRAASVALFFACSVATVLATNLLYTRALAGELRRERGRGGPVDAAGNGPANAAGDGFREVASYALPCYLGNLTQFLNYRADVFIVGAFAGAGAVGLYTLAVSLAQMLWMLSASAASVLLPRVAAAQGDVAGNAAHTARVCRLALAASACGAAVMALAMTQLLPLVYGEAFRESVRALLYLLPGIVAFSTVNVLAAFIAGMGRPRLNLSVALAALAVTLSLDLLLIPRMGITGAALATTASYFTSAVLTVRLFARETGTRARDVLVPTADDAAFLASFARPLLVRAGLRGAQT